MRRRDKGNLIAAACLAAFGIYVILGAERLDYTSEVGPGPGFFPFWIGTGLVVFAVGLILTNLLSSQRAPIKTSASWTAAGRALAGWFGLALTIVLFGLLGFAVSFVLLTIFFIAVLDRRPLLIATGIGVAMALAFHVLFVIALNVSMPAGPWGF
jgi:putative tricarboxylic transport membrane protein